MIATIVEFLDEPMVPIAIPPMLPTLMREDRVVSEVFVEGEARIKPRSIVVNGVVVAEVVVAVAGTQEEIVREGVEPDHNRRRIDEGCPGKDVPGETDRRKQGSPTIKRVIPIPVHKNVAARRPDVVVRDPSPTGLCERPEPRAPDVMIVPPNPDPRHPNVFGRGRDIDWPGLDRLRRLGQVFDFGHLSVSPVPGRPPVARVTDAPITRHPLASVRQIAPDPADPQEVVPLIVPGP